MTTETRNHRHRDIAGQEICVGAIIAYSGEHIKGLKYGLVRALPFTGQGGQERATLQVISTERLRRGSGQWHLKGSGTVIHLDRVLLVGECQVPGIVRQLFREGTVVPVRRPTHGTRTEAISAAFRQGLIR